MELEMFPVTLSWHLVTEMSATAHIADYQKSHSFRPAGEEQASPRAPENRATVFAKTQLSETEIGTVDPACAQIRRELIAAKYQRIRAGSFSTSDRPSAITESESPASYQKPQAMHYRDASVEQLSEAELGILGTACAKIRHDIIASRYKRLNGELSVGVDCPFHAPPSSGTCCGPVARAFRDPIAEQLSEADLDIKDPVCAEMRRQLIASRYKMLNNGLSRARVSFSDVEESSVDDFESPNCPSSLGSALHSSTPSVRYSPAGPPVPPVASSAPQTKLSSGQLQESPAVTATEATTSVLPTPILAQICRSQAINVCAVVGGLALVACYLTTLKK